MAQIVMTLIGRVEAGLDYSYMVVMDNGEDGLWSCLEAHMGNRVRLTILAEPEAGKAFACANEACGWRGELGDCVTPKHVPTRLLCPECHEVVEAGD